MISSIILKGVTSYSSDKDVVVDTNKKVNLFYGHNGTGKTTISDYLQDLNDIKFSKCNIIQDESDVQILVYNENFVERNFYESEQFPGVFTLAEANKTAEQNISSAGKEINRLEKEKEKYKKEIEIFESQKTEKLNSVKQKVWEAKNKYERTVLDDCIVGYKNSKDSFYQKVIKTPDDKIECTIEELEREKKELGEENGTVKAKISKCLNVFKNIEKDDIYQEVIVGSDESFLAPLIKRLGNSDWVMQGQSYLSIEKDSCPFCQQKLPHNFEEHIKDVFDNAYEEKIEKLSGLKSDYEEQIRNLQTALDSEEYKDNYVLEDKNFEVAKNKLLTHLNENLRKIQNKCSTPSIVIEINESEKLIDELNNVIDEINKRVEEFNDKIKNRKKHLKEINEKFWKLLKSKYKGHIDSYNKDSKELDQKIKNNKLEFENIEKLIAEEKQKIIENQKLITNIDISIDNINRQISLLGLDGFKIIKDSENENFYRLEREGKTDRVFKSLSEGEKTLIAFLYFIELCKGSLNSESSVDKKRKIVVIDDPISSLSHNYVYDVGSMIHNQIIKGLPYNQVFILTHSLFFFHELIKSAPRKKDVFEQRYNLYRITKNINSIIIAMDASDIQNDYQSYWQVIKDVKDGNVSKTVLPNMMRNILEYYFSFIHKTDDLSRALEDLEQEDSEFRPLYRYINRESHSDSFNITDFGEIDPDRFIEKFKRVFEKTSFIDHYNTMMGEFG